MGRKNTLARSRKRGAEPVTRWPQCPKRTHILQQPFLSISGRANSFMEEHKITVPKEWCVVFKLKNRNRAEKHTVPQNEASVGAKAIRLESRCKKCGRAKSLRTDAIGPEGHGKVPN